MILLTCSAFISGTEVAFFSLSRNDLEGNKEMETVKQLLKKPEELLSIILIANNFFNIAIIMTSTYICQKLFSNITNSVAVFFIEVISVTFLILLFGEVIPKVYANKNAVNFSMFMAKYVKVMIKILSPISKVLLKSSDLIENRIKIKNKSVHNSDFSRALALTSKEESSKEEQKILRDIISFGEKEAKQIMKHRLDIFALSIKMKYSEITELLLDEGYSRIPVYGNDLDDIKGVLYVKDLLPYIDEKEDFKWDFLIRPAFFTTKNKKIYQLLLDFKEKKNHLAIVVDEYGGTNGIITLEDIIEEIVGDISDEFDDDEIKYCKIDKDNYIFDAKTSLIDFYKILGIDNNSKMEESKGDAKTLGGFILEISGSIPEKNQTVNFENFIFKIENLDEKRIKSIKVSIIT
ncbi:hemolysin [Ichthyobacterium seriolicida]|uniref:Hemolysin n=2 Tax=Ichthyobacterium seriolicida TaxID=242600 RepID=A0A1J1DZJ0_9FLAO|nr:hemolysin [Ichthyobacterium seriolicida]